LEHCNIDNSFLSTITCQGVWFTRGGTLSNMFNMDWNKVKGAWKETNVFLWLMKHGKANSFRASIWLCWVMEKMASKKVHKGGYVVEHIPPTTCYVNVWSWRCVCCARVFLAWRSFLVLKVPMTKCLWLWSLWRSQQVWFVVRWFGWCVCCKYSEWWWTSCDCYSWWWEEKC
jgi:hypothetical protein